MNRADNDASPPAGFQAPSHEDAVPGGAESVDQNVPAGAADGLEILRYVFRRWFWLLAAGLGFGAIGFVLGIFLWKTSYTAAVELIRNEVPNVGDFFRPRQFSAETFVAMIRSPEINRRVAGDMGERVSPEAIRGRINIEADRRSEVIRLEAVGPTPDEAARLANLYAEKAMIFTRQLQVEEVQELHRAFLDHQLAKTEDQIAAVRKTLLELPPPREITERFSQLDGALREMNLQFRNRLPPSLERLMDRVQTVREEGMSLHARFTELHPRVREHQRRLASLESELEIRMREHQAALATTPTLNSGISGGGEGEGSADISDATVPPNPTGVNQTVRTSGFLTPIPNNLEETLDSDVLRHKLQILEQNRILLLNRRLEASLFAENPPGYYRVFAPASSQRVFSDPAWPKIALLTVLGCGFGLLSGLAGILAQDRARVYPWVRHELFGN
jgi:capsular polysaccharide biosynthesis protein